MAKVAVGDYIDIGTTGPLFASQFVVALDKDFKYIVDQTYENDEVSKGPGFSKVWVREWHTPLPKLQVGDDGIPILTDRGTTIHVDNGECYKDLDELWAKFRIKVGVEEDDTVTTSDWFIIGPKSQLIQDVIITEEGKEPIYTDTVELEEIYGGD